MKNLFLLFAFVLSITTTGNLHSQDNITSQGPLFMESVWLSTDRHIYVPGEKIEFAAIVLEADSYTPSQLSKILKVELFDANGKSYSQSEFLLDKSKINQHISIPSSAPGGWYYIRAYTNWMRNSSEALNKFIPIKIINPERVSVVSDNTPLGDLVATVKTENNNLVAGMVNNCSVRMESLSGEKIGLRASLISGRNDTIISFITDDTGWGSFSFTPRVNMQYSIVSYDASGIRTVIPEVVADVPYTTFNDEGNNFRISISGSNSDIVKLLVHRNYTWYDFQVMQTVNGTALFSVPAYLITGGITQFTLLSADNRILYSRLYMSNGTGVNPQISQTRLSEDMVESEVVINAAGRSGSQLISTIVSVEEPFDIFELYMPGSPGWQFSYDIPLNKNAREGWLIANSYDADVARSFFNKSGTELLSWSAIDKLQANKIEAHYDFLPETRGYTLNGSVTDADGIGLNNLVISATLLSDNSFYTGRTFESGRFHLVFPDRAGNDDAIVTFTQEPEDGWKLDIEPQFDISDVLLPQIAYRVSLKEAEFIRDLDVNRQIEAIYGIDQNSGGVTESNSTNVQKSFFGTPDQVTKVDDFVSLSNIREVLFEVVPRVTVRKQEGLYKLGIITELPMPSAYHPLFMLDGIPFYEFDKFLELPPDRLLEIDLLSRHYIHGNSSFTGIVNFLTVNNDLAGLELPGKSQILSIDMPSRGSVREYMQKQSADDATPKLYSTLYWEPLSNSTLYKYSIVRNDNPGRYVNRVLGFNANGQWIHNKKSVTFATEVAEDNE